MLQIASSSFLYWENIYNKQGHIIKRRTSQ